MSSIPSVSLSILRTLHRIHGQLADLRERLARGPQTSSRQRGQRRLPGTRIGPTRDEAKAMRLAADQKQLQLKTGEGKIKDLKSKLNAAASNREYQILKEQIAADEMAKSVLEDEIIEALEKIDQFHPQIAQAEAALATAHQKVVEVRQEVQRQQPLIQGDMQRLEAELKECETVLPPAVRDVYLRTVRQKGQDALAAVERDKAGAQNKDDAFCSGCHTQVPLNLQAEIRLGHPSFCKTCGRLLYLSEAEAAAK